MITEGPDPVFRPRARDPEAERRARADSAFRPTSRFFLYVGGLSPHKNLLRLVEAFAQAAPADVKLVLVGDVHDVFHTHVPQIRAAIARHALEDRVILAGFVPDEELVLLYSRAYALILPSLLEGFGLPAVEAMACGTPVISSRAGSLPEVVGEAGVYFEPTDVDFDRRRDPSSSGLDPRLAMHWPGWRGERSGLFTWDESARRLLACFDELDATRHRSCARRSRLKTSIASPPTPSPR